MSDLTDITILITSFLRFGYLKKCYEGINENLCSAGCRLVIVDDGDDVNKTIDVQEGCCDSKTQFIRLPFDSGLSRKRNVGVAVCQTPYLLLGCDDFDFSTKEAREGIEKMVKVLDENPEIDVASGRVDSHPYEGFVDLKKDEFVQETRLDVSDMKDGEFKLCDLTVNYFLARTDSIRDTPWDERLKIGGEHFLWFWHMKQNGKIVAFVKDVNINTQPYDPAKQDSRYAEFRSRAVGLGHRIMMETMGIKEYRGF